MTVRLTYNGDRIEVENVRSLRERLIVWRLRTKDGRKLYFTKKETKRMRIMKS